MKRRWFVFALLLIFLFPLLSLTALPAGARGEGMLTVYFPNWNVYSSSDGQVKDLPWDFVDCVNHAFWKIAPKDGGYAIVSTDPRADTDVKNPKAHFPQYARYAENNPQVKILLSIGGWTCCGYFSEMACTQEGRASFIESCLETLDAYPFFSGLDIDWEYPGVARAGGSGDEGNPVKGDDKTNYTLLLQELRAALDAHFGLGQKLLTVCASGSVSTLRKQDYAALFPYVDRINLMTYDMTGAYADKTGHHSPLYGSASADTAVKYLQDQGVPAGKIAIGSPLYGYGWTMKFDRKNPVGSPGTGLTNGSPTWRELKPLEEMAVEQGTPGWHLGLDEKTQGAYLWNDDPDSDAFRVFYTYESSQSLAAKLTYIHVHSLGGLIVWESGGDSSVAGWPMLRQMHEGLHP